MGCLPGVSAPLLESISAAASRVVTANDFVFDCRLESVNLLPLLTWTKEVKLLQKVC